MQKTFFYALLLSLMTAGADTELAAAPKKMIQKKKNNKKRLRSLKRPGRINRRKISREIKNIEDKKNDAKENIKKLRSKNRKIRNAAEKIVAEAETKTMEGIAEQEAKIAAADKVEESIINKSIGMESTSAESQNGDEKTDEEKKTDEESKSFYQKHKTSIKALGALATLGAITAGGYYMGNPNAESTTGIIASGFNNMASSVSNTFTNAKSYLTGYWSK